MYSTYHTMILTTDLPSLREALASETDAPIEALLWITDLGPRALVKLSAEGMYLLLCRKASEGWSARPGGTATERGWYTLRGGAGGPYLIYIRD